MDIVLNEDWTSARQRLEAFWEHEIVDRPCLQVCVEDHPATPAPGVDPQRYWTEPQTFFRFERARYLNKGYLGEAFPLLYLQSWDIPEMLGADLRYAPGTIWSRPCATALHEIDLCVFALSHPVIQRTAGMVRYCAEHGAGECFVGFPQMPNAGDTLAILRGWENLCLDIADDPATVLALDAQITHIWKALYDLFYGIVNEHMEGSCGWLPAWHPRRSALIEFDFAGLISPDHFKLFIPHLLERADHAERAIYHLDGPNALVHLDTLLALPEIDAVQWEPGAGGGDILTWMPVMQRIQAAGKSLYVGGGSHEPPKALTLLRELHPEGLLIPVKVSHKETGLRFLEQVQELF